MNSLDLGVCGCGFYRPLRGKSALGVREKLAGRLQFSHCLPSRRIGPDKWNANGEREDRDTALDALGTYANDSMGSSRTEGGEAFAGMLLRR